MLDFLKRKKKEEKEQKGRKESGEIGIKGKMKSMSDLKKELKKLTIFGEIKEENGGITGLIVESTDKNKNPHLFIRINFNKDSVTANYSIPPEVPNPTMRELHVTRTVFTILSLLEERSVFLPERADLYSKTMKALELGNGLADSDSLKMKYELQRCTADRGLMKQELDILRQEKEGLNHKLLELEKKCSLLEDRVRQLESMTDSELDREIIRWVEEHDGTLDEEGFCSSLGVQGRRLEERMDSLSKRGVIRIV